MKHSSVYPISADAYVCTSFLAIHRQRETEHVPPLELFSAQIRPP